MSGMTGGDGFPIKNVGIDEKNRSRFKSSRLRVEELLRVDARTGFSGIEHVGRILFGPEVGPWLYSLGGQRFVPQII